jgi:hypothetical protein
MYRATGFAEGFHGTPHRYVHIANARSAISIVEVIGSKEDLSLTASSNDE